MPTAAYRPSIDGLRAFAVLSVIGFHAFPGYVSGGFIGVDIFFVISGYLITNSLLIDQKNHCTSIIKFYQRRIRRIFPALGLVITACLAFGWVALLSDEYTYLGPHAAGGASFVSNLVYWNEAGYFDYSSELKPLLHLWSLGIEEQFYIVYPVILIIIWHWKLPLKATIVALTFISFWIANTQIATDPVATFYSPISRGWELLVGGLLAASQDTIKLLSYKRYADIASLLGLFLLIAGVIGMTNNIPFPGGWALIPVLGATLIIASGETAYINKYILNHQILVWVGLFSYPLYLWHWPLLAYAKILDSGEVPRAHRIAAILIAGIMGWATYRFIEKPLQRKKGEMLRLFSFCQP